MKWLQWLIDNPMMVVVIGGVLVQMLKAVFGRKLPDEGAADNESKEVVFSDPELAERTRKIREEIQRKIETRARGREPAAPQPTVAPPVMAHFQAARLAVRDVRRDAEILEEQAALMERLREAEAMKATASRRTEFEQATADHSAERRAKTRQEVIGDLRSPAAMRRAFVLRELLSPPVALRR